MSSVLRIGVVGVGALSSGRSFRHLSTPDLSGTLKLTALCDPVMERAELVAGQHGVEHVFDSLSAMLEADVVDAVTIVSPIGLHYQHVRDALAAGKHVHVNKTMTTTVEEADEVIGLARDRGLALVASPGEVLRPQVSAVRDAIGSGSIGKVAWAICGCAFEQYHEDEPERDLAGGIDPTWYYRFPEADPWTT
ncbi:MAG: Gfo/Idh/MocA family oxidoreductase [Nocardioidaceae bacterium]